MRRMEKEEPPPLREILSCGFWDGVFTEDVISSSDFPVDLVDDLHEVKLLVVENPQILPSDENKACVKAVDGGSKSSGIACIDEPSTYFFGYFFAQTSLLRGIGGELEKLKGKIIAIKKYWIKEIKNRRYPIVLDFKMLTTNSVATVEVSLDTLSFRLHKNFGILPNEKASVKESCSDEQKTSKKSENRDFEGKKLTFSQSIEGRRGNHQRSAELEALDPLEASDTNTPTVKQKRKRLKQQSSVVSVKPTYTTSEGAEDSLKNTTGGGSVFNFSSPGPVARQKAETMVSLKALNRYTSSWYIVARVSSKGQIHTFSNDYGEGQLFNVELLDEEGTQIRATFFGNAVSKFFDRIQDGKVYTMSHGSVQLANKKFNSFAHDYEIKFDDRAQVEEVLDYHVIPAHAYHFIPIKEVLTSCQIGQIVDVAGIVCDYGEIASIRIKTRGTEILRREISIFDHTHMKITLTLWGIEANRQLKEGILSGEPIILVKNVKVGEYLGKKLDTIINTKIVVDTDSEEVGKIPLVASLRALKEQKQCESSENPSTTSLIFQCVSWDDNTKTVEEILSLTELHSDRIEEFSSSRSSAFICKCVIVNIQKDPFYWRGCKNCKKKLVTAEDDGVSSLKRVWCSHCSNYTSIKYNWLLRLQIADHSGNMWCTAIGNSGQTLMTPMKANLEDFVSSSEDAGFTSNDKLGRSIQDVFNNLRFSEWMLQLSSQQETYKEEKSVQFKILRGSKLDEHTSELLDQGFVLCLNALKDSSVKMTD